MSLPQSPLTVHLDCLTENYNTLDGNGHIHCCVTIHFVTDTRNSSQTLGIHNWLYPPSLLMDIFIAVPYQNNLFHQRQSERIIG